MAAIATCRRIGDPLLHNVDGLRNFSADVRWGIRTLDRTVHELRILFQGVHRRRNFLCFSSLEIYLSIFAVSSSASVYARWSVGYLLWTAPPS